MKDLLEYFLLKILDHPKEMVILEEEENEALVLRLKVDPEDMGKVIGKRGKTIQSLRNLLHLKGLLLKKRIILQLVEK